MSFTTLTFLIFFALAAAGYYLLPQKLRRYFLLAASYVFYMWRQPAFGLLLLCGTAGSFFAALAVEAAVLGKRKPWFILGLLYIFGLLFAFKYLNFFCGVLGLAAGWSLVLPVGISFFSFAMAGYIFDVYRGKIPAERSFIDYAVFVSFFPSLLAGPIGRAREFLPQLKRPREFDAGLVKRGILRFVWGAFKKLVIADRLRLVVDAAYASPGDCSAAGLLVAAAAYSLEIYFDFAAYSDMAIGAAGILGFRLMENFRAPYLSGSVKAFWRKWHISLTSWFREYLYFPLGGSRGSSARTYLNVLLVFAVSGLWHGAGLTFIVWGLLNGLYQVAGQMTLPLRSRLRGLLRIRDDSLPLRALRTALTFILITVAWVFFRAESLSQALFILGRILLGFRDGFGAPGLPISLRQLAVLIAAMLPALAEDILIAAGRPFPAIEKTDCRFWLAVAALAALVFLFGVYGAGFNAQDFVYFKF